LDMARLALDADAPIEFNQPYWAGFAQATATAYFAGLRWTETRWGGLPSCHDGTRGEIIIHPLWSGAVHASVSNALQEATTVGIGVPVVKTLFEAVRRPF
jgi:hypothetical protein